MTDSPTPPESRSESNGFDPPGTFETDAELTLFGYDTQPARARVASRGRGWRVGGAARTMALFAVISPFVAIIPPHAVWLIGALLTGAVLARKRYIERFTLLSVSGVCPKCGAALSVKSGRLRLPHPMPCDACHHESALRIAEGRLAAHARD